MSEMWGCVRLKKVQLSDTAQGTRSPIRHTKKTGGSNVWTLILNFSKWVCIDEYVCDINF